VHGSQGRRRRFGKLHGLAACDREHGRVDGIEVGGGAACSEQLVGGEVPAAGGERERAAPDVPAIPRLVRVGAGVEQHREDGQSAAARDRVVQAAVGVDVDAVVEEPLQPGGVFEVELVVDEVLVPGRVEEVQEGGVALFAGVVEGVIVALGAALDQQLGELEVAALDGVVERRHLSLPAPLDGVAVRVGTRVQQQPRALAHVRRCAGGATEEQDEWREPVDRYGRRRGEQLGQGRRVGENERPLDAVQAAGLRSIGHGEPPLSATKSRATAPNAAGSSSHGR
jgi:hypothetical protein